MSALLTDPQTYLSFFTLTALEIVLGIDNLLFLSVVVARLPDHQKELARRLGVTLALFGRIGLLFSLSWILGLTQPLFAFLGFSFTGHNLVLIVGGGFLVYKACQEIAELFRAAHGPRTVSQSPSLLSALTQILVLDLVFSLDSVITAVGLSSQMLVMCSAIIISVVIMFFFSRTVSEFLERYPSLKVLGLAFLLLVGAMLVSDGIGFHTSKSYVYVMLAFALGVEMINIYLRRAGIKSI